MSFLGGIVKSVINPMSLAQLAMGPAGLAAFAMRTIGTAIGQQVIQQLGQKLGLPQGIISLAQQTFAATTGGQGGPLNIREAVANLGQNINFSPAQQGLIARAADNVVGGVVREVTNQLGSNVAETLRKMSLDQTLNAEKLRSQEATDEASSKVGSGGDVAERLGITGGFLVSLAVAMGKVLDNKMNQLQRLTKEMNGVGEKQAAFGKVDEKNQGKFQALGSEIQSISSLLQGVSQEMNVLSQALKTSIDSVGQGQATLARKG